ncbi:MAG: carbon-nitrogen hydrolase family protein, partial [Clostridia bacterium]|nr:carbon-nitrogen hydrolase family protein [Clostridia bacterium]
MKTAMLQIPVGFDKQKNIIHAMAAVEWAAENGADIAVLPEMWNCPYSNKYFQGYAEEGIGESRAAMSDTAKRLGIYL